MEFVTRYFNAERAESLLFMAVGVAAVSLAWWLMHGRPGAFSKGIAYPLIAVAAIQLTVGIGIFLRSPADIERVSAMLVDAPHIASAEIPRMAKVMRNFVLYRYLETTLLVAGVGLLLFARAWPWWHGVGLGLATQAGLMLVLDLFAEARGEIYLTGLRDLIGQ